MSRRSYTALWTKAFKRSMAAATRSSVAVGKRVVKRAIQDAVARSQPPPGEGDWIAGMALGLKGARRFRLYRPPGVKAGERIIVEGLQKAKPGDVVKAVDTAAASAGNTAPAAQPAAK